jgi:hypothetical protein
LAVALVWLLAMAAGGYAYGFHQCGGFGGWDAPLMLALIGLYAICCRAFRNLPWAWAHAAVLLLVGYAALCVGGAFGWIGFVEPAGAAWWPTFIKGLHGGC